MKLPQLHSGSAALRLRVALWIVPLLLAGVRPASAQFEFAGSWSRVSTDLGGGGGAVDYIGLPLNDEGRSRGLTYSVSTLSMPERQCQGWAPPYLLRGIFAMKVWPEIDPVTGGTLAFTIGGWEDRRPITIWMDGRPDPSPYAVHARGGFATGRWEDNSLVASITHLNANFLGPTGPPMSDEATITMRFTRRGSLLMIVAVVDDPIYLADPYVLSAVFENVPQLGWAAGPPCIIGDEGNSEDHVRHYLPGKNPFIDEVTKATHIPREAVLGGADTTYPEYRKKIKDAYLSGNGMKR